MMDAAAQMIQEDEKVEEEQKASAKKEDKIEEEWSKFADQQE